MACANIEIDGNGKYKALVIKNCTGGKYRLLISTSDGTIGVELTFDVISDLINLNSEIVQAVINYHSYNSSNLVAA